MLHRPRFGIRCTTSGADREWWRAAEAAGVDWIGIGPVTPVAAAAAVLVTNDATIGWTPGPLTAGTRDGAYVGELAHAAAALADAADGRLDLVLADDGLAGTFTDALRLLWAGGPVSFAQGPVRLDGAVCAPAPTVPPRIVFDRTAPIPAGTAPAGPAPSRPPELILTTPDSVPARPGVSDDDDDGDAAGNGASELAVCIPYAAAVADPAVLVHAFVAAAELGASLLVLDTDDEPDVESMTALAQVCARIRGGAASASDVSE